MPRHALRRLAALLAVAVIVLGGIALPAAAKHANGRGRGHSISEIARSKNQTKHQNKRQNRNQRGRGRSKVRVVKFTAVGTVVGVADNLVVVDVSGGSRDLRGDIVTVAFAQDARVKVNDAPATLADISDGDHAAVKGYVSGESLVGTRINAETPAPEPTEDATEGTTDGASGDVIVDDPTDSPTGDDTGDVVTP